MPIAVTVVHDDVPVVFKVDNELLELAEEFGLLGAGLSFQIPAQAFHSAQRRIGAAVPQVPLDAMQRLDQCGIAGAIAVCRPGLIICSRFCTRMAMWNQSRTYSPRSPKTVLGKPYGIPAVRQEGHRLTRLHTFT